MPNSILSPAFIGHLLAAILALGFLITLALFLRERRNLQKLLKDNSFESVRRKNAAILAEALEKAQNVVEKSRLSVDKFENYFQGQFNSQAEKAQQALDKHLETIRSQSERAELLSASYTKEKANGILERFEKNLESFLTQAEAKSTQSLESELAAVRQTIETYKKQQLSLVDENIVAMLEKTLGLVLAKKISLKDQLDLVYEALEKAKVEKFIL
ncbi:MAG: hypothetical protein UV41_C0016G0008 [Candidatus Daviesbacteria bacterium GW2011_GWA2_42_7]|nr:MAG: hypothetical protein UV41_C0016G0008 [Candidatus Daviesbacteria bacterium GW2011_GWA2_42_7]